jgi:hypothetical protein
MNVLFCDLCNESIPQGDLDAGRAVRRNGRLICVACEAAMTPRPPAPPGPSRPAAPRGTPGQGASSILAIALAFAAVAVVVSAGSSAWLLVRFDGRMNDLQALQRASQRDAFDRERRLAATMEAGAGENGALMRGLQEGQRRTEARLGDLELAVERARGLADRLDGIEGRLADLARLGGVQDRMATEMAELGLTLAELREALRPAEATAEPAREERVVSKRPEAPTERAPSWMGLVGDLSSQNSGTRWQAVQALAKTGDAAVVPHLLPRLEDTDIFVRMAAARTLGDLGARDAIPSLIDTLEDEEASVREAALVSLRTLSKQDIAFDPLAREGERAKRVKDWRDWWERASREN